MKEMIYCAYEFDLLNSKGVYVCICIYIHCDLLNFEGVCMTFSHFSVSN